MVAGGRRQRFVMVGVGVGVREGQERKRKAIASSWFVLCFRLPCPDGRNSLRRSLERPGVVEARRIGAVKRIHDQLEGLNPDARYSTF